MTYRPGEGHDEGLEDTMGDITIRLQYNLKTGKKDVWIDLVSEPDSLPIEHEQDHRRIVEQLLGKGVLQADELGEIEVRRIQPEPASQADAEVAADERIRSDA